MTGCSARRAASPAGPAARPAPTARCAGSSTRSTARSTTSTACRSTRCRSRPRWTGWCVAGVVRQRGHRRGVDGGPRRRRLADGRRLSRVRRRPSLDQALVATGFGYDAARRAHQARCWPACCRGSATSGGSGAAALDLCLAAEGRVDAYFEKGLNAWDHAAGGLIATEAGLLVTGLRGAAARTGHGGRRPAGRASPAARPARRAGRRRRPMTAGRRPPARRPQAAQVPG